MQVYKPLLRFYDTRLLAKLIKICQPLAINLGLDAFAYSRITRDCGFYQISTVPEPSIFYWETGLYQDNLFLRSPDSYEEGIFLLRSIPSSNFQQMLNSFSQLGVEWHLRIVRKEEGVCHQFLYGSTIKNLPFTAMFINNIMILERFNDYFLEEGLDLIRQCDTFAFSLPELLGEKYKSKIKHTSCGVKDLSKTQFIKQIDKDFAALEKLTDREFDCIRQYIKGKTARQIGESLHISNRTVEHHLENIKFKLGCSSKLELFERLQKFQQLRIL